MKRYVSAILIPCLIMQLYGCYGQRQITYGELISSKNQNISVIINDTSIYNFGYKSSIDNEIVMHPEVNYCIKADTTFDKLILQRKAVTKGLNKKPSISIDTLTYNKNEIRSMTIKEINGGQTALLVIGIITAAALIAYLIALSTFKLDLSGMKLFEGQRF